MKRLPPGTVRLVFSALAYGLIALGLAGLYWPLSPLGVGLLLYLDLLLTSRRPNDDRTD